MVRVLYVDDEELLRVVFRRALEPHGYEVVTADSAEAAERCFDQQDFDIVVSDVRMPGRDGISLTADLAARQTGTAFVLVSGLPELDAESGRADHVFSLVSKPWLEEDLLETLEHAVEYGRDRRTRRNTADTQSLLLVEDSPGDAELMRIFLGVEEDKLSFEEAPSARDAMARIRERSFNVIITDLGLPDARGVEIVRRLCLEAPDSAIVVVSGHPDEDLAYRTLALGAQDFILKDDLKHLDLNRVLRFAVERKRAERRLIEKAHLDPISGLHSRLSFDERLKLVIRRARRNHSPFGVALLDLDGFKPINDTHGHMVGDSVLRAIGDRIRGVVRDYDICARMGGDEFAIISEQPTDQGALAGICYRLVKAISEPVIVDDLEIHVRASVGAATFPDHGDTAEQLIQVADAEMYRAKRKGGDDFCLPEAVEVSPTRRLHADIQRAARNLDFKLHYQPIVDLRSTSTVGVEALLRWEQNPGHFVSPAAFVPVLEESGLIVDIGAWVIDETCAQLQRWQESIGRKLRASVNVSAYQFESSVLPDAIEQALHRNGIQADQVEIEITESILMRNTKASNTVLQAIKKMGLSVAIDDFGTGYSSLAYLNRFQVDVLKIDRSFVRDIGQNQSSEALAAAIISLGRRLNLRVVAEGVETREQADFLREAGCDFAQGFLFARPGPPEEILLHLAETEPNVLVHSHNKSA